MQEIFSINENSCGNYKFFTLFSLIIAIKKTIANEEK